MEPLVAKSDLAGYLRAHGVTPTRQRLIISEVLFDFTKNRKLIENLNG